LQARFHEDTSCGYFDRDLSKKQAKIDLVHTIAPQPKTDIMRVAALGLDVGGKRIGVAGCDGLGLIATGITTIWRSSLATDIDCLQQIIMERDVEILVMGLPYTMDGKLGSQAKQVQKFARKVGAVIDLPIEYVDERLTSYAAEEMMKAANISVSQNKATIDRIAAAVILQQWLDLKRDRLTLPPTIELGTLS
jgi:putative holliday junction resolvase